MRVVARRPYFTSAVAIGVTTGVFGLSFGVLAVTTSLSIWQTCAMSAFIFTGASQFAAIGVIAAGGSPLAAVGSGLLLGARNAAYGLAMAPILPRPFLARAVSTQLVIDESPALSTAHPEDPRGAFFAGGVSVFVFWNVGTLLGALAGAGIGSPADYGLDAAFAASLLALVAPRLREKAARRAGLLGALIALVLTPILEPGLPIILASLAVVPELLRGESR